MKLSTYLKKNKTKPSPWAVKNGMCPATILKYLAGGDISAHTVLKIYYASKKEVGLLTILRAMVYRTNRRLYLQR